MYNTTIDIKKFYQLPFLSGDKQGKNGSHAYIVRNAGRAATIEILKDDSFYIGRLAARIQRRIGRVTRSGWSVHYQQTKGRNCAHNC
jgi:hypothetical protein